MHNIAVFAAAAALWTGVVAQDTFAFFRTASDPNCVEGDPFQRIDVGQCTTTPNPTSLQPVSIPLGCTCEFDYFFCPP